MPEPHRDEARPTTEDRHSMQSAEAEPLGEARPASLVGTAVETEVLATTPQSDSAPVRPWHSDGTLSSPAARREANSFCRDVLTSEQYRKRLRARAVAGDLPAAVETMLWDRAYGKVTDRIEVKRVDELGGKSLVELREETKRIQQELDEIERIEKAIPAEYTVES